MNPVQVKKGRSETLCKRKDTGKLKEIPPLPKPKPERDKKEKKTVIQSVKRPQAETNLKNAKEIRKRKGKRNCLFRYYQLHPLMPYMLCHA